MIENNEDVCICSICRDTVKHEKSIVSLILHLTSKHDINEMAFCANKKIRLALFSESENESSDEETDLDLEKKLNNKLVNLLVSCNLPISLVQMNEFVDFINEVAPNYQIPCRQKITKRLIPEKVDIFKAQIKHEMNQINCCALSSDVWTSNSMLSYLGVFVHFVNEKFELVCRFLELRYLEQSHTNEYLCD
ncbi:unnamed protein product [Brachionus calyciflorus]|uniref:Uncharacterized protein n=1 Tax=Brachionus calyciflorus TaxID=104777 RepID=A0A814IU03_9BILA|nr:unnamed protein product [Brachionus calyciflorus]